MLPEERVLEAGRMKERTERCAPELHGDRRVEEIGVCGRRDCEQTRKRRLAFGVDGVELVVACERTRAHRRPESPFEVRALQVDDGDLHDSPDDEYAPVHDDHVVAVAHAVSALRLGDHEVLDRAAKSEGAVDRSERHTAAGTGAVHRDHACLTIHPARLAAAQSRAPARGKREEGAATPACSAGATLPRESGRSQQVSWYSSQVDLGRLGERIREERTAAKLASSVVALRARVTEDDLLALEAGRPVTLSTAAVTRIARAIGVATADLAQETAGSPSLFFLQPGVPDFFDADRDVVVGALRAARSIAELDRLLGRTYPRGELDPVDVGPVPFEQGYELARRVRGVLGAPSEPLGSVVEIVEDVFGVPVVRMPLKARRVVALTAKDSSTRLAAVVLSDVGTDNARVTVAHELAHVLFDKPEKPIDYWIDLENDQAADTSKIEQRARAFAAELLIPRRGLVDLLGPQTQRSASQRTSRTEARELVQRVCSHFRTPPELTTNRLVDDVYIDQGLRADVWKGLSGSSWHPKPRPPMLHRRLADALRAGLITRMRAREYLGLSAWDDLPSELAS